MKLNLSLTTLPGVWKATKLQSKSSLSGRNIRV
jgi:hypothetical protein